MQGTGKIELKAAGPRSSEFGLFDEKNNAVDLVGGAYFRLSDPGAKSALDFDKGDSITLEAWVNVRKMSQGFGYVLGKGRTQNPGFPSDNQNYALRLSRSGSGAGITFLFRSAGKDADWHRWTSNGAMGIGDGWHHVAVTYTFGKADSLRGYVDGEAVKGKWDMGGKTDRAPVVDDDELWIGSSMGGSGTSALNGQIDEVAIYRTALSPERIVARFQFEGKQLPEGPIQSLAQDRVRVEIFERIEDKKSWRFRRAEFVEAFDLPAFAVFAVPQKYSNKAIRVDRSNPFLIRVWGQVRIPKDAERMLVRSRNASRLFIDGKQIAETAFHSISGGERSPRAARRYRKGRSFQGRRKRTSRAVGDDRRRTGTSAGIGRDGNLHGDRQRGLPRAEQHARHAADGRGVAPACHATADSDRRSKPTKSFAGRA